MSARAGSGVVVARLSDDSWSAPSALGLGGLGAGFNAGLDVTDFLIVLNSKQAVRSFMATGSLQLGGNLSLAVGPLGRAAEASGALNSSGNVAAMFSYSKSKGLYGGVSVEGTVLVDRSDANSKAYHRNVTAKQILGGGVEMPNFAQPLISLIEKHTLTGEVGVGVDGYSRSTSNDQGGAWHNHHDTYESDVDSLDRELRRSRLSSSIRSMSPNQSPRRSDSSWDDAHQRQDDYTALRAQQRGYAFGSDGRHATKTNSPTLSRKSMMGNTVPRGTDYGLDGGDPVFNTPQQRRDKYQSRHANDADSFARSGVQPRPNEILAVQRFAGGPDDYGSALSVSRSHRTAANFATKFSNADSSSDDILESTGGDFSNGSGGPTHDLFKSGDLIDFSEDDAPTTSWIDDAAPTRRTHPRGSSGFDSLDRELQGRGSISADESHERHKSSGVPLLGSEAGNSTAAKGWRADYGLPAENYAAAPAPQRPPLHGRTSSAQKLWNRVRGNSQGKMSPSASFSDTWESRQRAREWERQNSPGPGVGMGSSRGSRSSTPAQQQRKSGTMSTSSSQQRQWQMRSESPSASRAMGTTPPPAAVVAAALGRTSNTTPRARAGPSRGSNGNEYVARRAESPSNGSSNASAIHDVEQRVVALFDFDGQEIDDLSFKRGDMIDILRKTDNRDDWWLGRCRGQVGKCVVGYGIGEAGGRTRLILAREQRC